MFSQLSKDKRVTRSELIIKELEDLLMSSLITALVDNQTKRGPYQGQYNKYVEIAAEYLTANLKSPIQSKILAKISGVSYRTLSRAFIKRFGITPLGFLRERRLYAAREQLIRSSPYEVTISNVAEEFGFNNLGNFSIQYKKLFGESPSETVRS